MPTPYHLLTRTDPRHRAWQLPAAGLMAVGAFLVAATLVRPGAWDPVERPLRLAVDLGTIALLAPILLGALWVAGSPALRWIWSAEGRVRWGWWGRCCAIAFGAVAAATVLASLLPDSGVGREVMVPSMTAWFGVVVALALVPGQALGEELLFRGFLPQLIATVAPIAWIGVAASTCFYVAVQTGGTWALVEAAILGLGAGVLTQRTGGLEAAVALHVATTLIRIALEAGGAVAPPDVRADPGAASVLPTLLAVLAVAVLVEWQARATGLVRRRPDAPGTPVAGASAPVSAAPREARVHPRSPGYPGEIGDDWGR